MLDGAPCAPRAGSVAASRPQPPLDAAGVQDAAGDLLDRALGGVEPRQRVAGKQRLGRAQLVQLLLPRGVAAVRPALVADLLQPLGPDGERKQLGAIRLEPWRQPSRLQIVLGERIVGGEHSVLQRHVHTGGRLADPRHTDQHHIGVRIVAAAAVVVGEREVGSLDARRVGGEIGHAVCAPGAVRRARVELALERTDERREQVEEQRIRPHEDLAQIVLHQSAEHDRTQTLACRAVDAPNGLLRLVKAEEAVRRINRAASQGLRPIVFSTLVQDDLREILMGANALFLDLFSTFVGPLERELDARSTHRAGRAHGMADLAAYTTRIEATNFSLANDDGSGGDYAHADVVLIGVSRVGKTPTCVYMALQYGVFAANYPLTEDDLEAGRLPPRLEPYRAKLFALTIKPERLQQIRNERRPDSRYASRQQVLYELRAAEALFSRYALPWLDTTECSIEEIASRILNTSGIERRLRP